MTYEEGSVMICGSPAYDKYRVPDIPKILYNLRGVRELLLKCWSLLELREMWDVCYSEIMLD